MTSQPSRCCAVCSCAIERRGSAYLLSSGSDSLSIRIYRWDGKPVALAREQLACQSAHAIEIAAFWMVTGSLQLTFAQSTPAGVLQAVARPNSTCEPPPQFTWGGTGSSLVGELEMDHSARQGTSSANVALQVSLLDALSEAMNGGEHKLPCRPSLRVQETRKDWTA